MSNLCQPQGVILAIALAVAMPFYPIEFKEDGQTTIPNLVNIDGTGHSGNAELVVNDGLLRTHHDSMVFAVDNTGGSDLALTIHVAKQPITDIAVANAAKADYFITSYPLTIKADEIRHLELRLVNGQYVLSEQAQGCANLGIGNPDTDLLAVYTAAKV